MRRIGKTLVADAANDVSWTQLYGIFNRAQISAFQARRYNNTLRMTNSAPIGALVDPAVALVAQNSGRSLLIMQNTSTATAPDYAPTMYFGFGISPVDGYNLALPPGVGIVLDVRVPSDAIYVGLGAYSGASVVISGSVSEGGITDPENDTVNIAETGQLTELVALLKQLLLQN